MDFRVRAVRLGAADAARLRELSVCNRVAPVLLALALRELHPDAVEALLAAVRGLVEPPWQGGELLRFIPVVEGVLRIGDAERAEARRRLREGGTMPSLLEELWTEAEAEGMAKGRAEGEAKARCESGRAMLATLRRLVERLVLTREQARAQIEELRAAGALPDDMAREALAEFA